MSADALRSHAEASEAGPPPVAVGTGVAVFDREGRLVVGNRRFHDLFAGDDDFPAPGLAYGAFLTHQADTLFDPAEAIRLEPLMRRPWPGAEPLATPLLLQCRDGRWLELEEQATSSGGIVCLWTDATNRMVAETEIVRLQGHLHDALESLSDGFTLFDADDRLDVHNAAFSSLYRLPPDESLLGMRFDEVMARMAALGLFGELDATMIAALAERHRSPGEPVELRLADGRWIRVTETRARDGGVAGIHSDVTEFKRREEELARRTGMLDAVTWAATRMVGRGDWQSGIGDLMSRLGRAAQVGRAALHQAHTLSDGSIMLACLYEWTAEGVAGVTADPAARVERWGDGTAPHPWTDPLRHGAIVHGHTRDLDDDLRTGLESRGVRSFLAVPLMVDDGWWGHITFEEFAYRGDGGHRVWSPLEIDVVSSAAALLAGAIRRASLDVELHRSEARMQAIVETALDCIVAVDAAGNFVEFNPAAERTFGHRRADVLGRRMEDLIVPPALRGAHRAGFARFFNGEGGRVIGRRVEMTALRADGTEFPVELAITPTRVGDEMFFTAWLRDITSRKEAERALIDAKTRAESAAQAKSAFLGTMSHELRTPLNAIIGFSELIRDEAMGPLGERKYAEFAADIHDSGNHLLGIINDVLAMSKIEAGEHRLNRESLDLSALVRSCMAMLRERARAAGVTLSDETGPLPIGLWADRTAVMKILLNLLSNAVKFTPAGGRAAVGAVVDGEGHVVLEVRDTGVGVPADALERVFDPFQQADMGINRRHEGAGLGLTVTKALVDLHGGTITLASTPGAGTTVTVRFPPGDGRGS